MLSLGRVALAVVLLASIGCDASRDRVYDDTTLRLTVYMAPRPGEVVLEWTGGPSGYRRWEYYTLGPGSPLPGVWRDVPEDAGLGRRMRLSLEPGAGYNFMIRERGDERDPTGTNPGAVARVNAPGVGEHGLTYIYGRPLEPGARFWLGYHGLPVTAPPEGKLIISIPSGCAGQLIQFFLTLPMDDGEVAAYAELVSVPVDRVEYVESVAESSMEGRALAEELLSQPGFEARVDDLTAREQAESAEDPDVREAYRLMVDVLESVFGRYPATASEGLADSVCH